MSCSFIIHIDGLVALEVPIHKRRKRGINFDGFTCIILSAHKLWCP